MKRWAIAAGWCVLSAVAGCDDGAMVSADVPGADVPGADVTGSDAAAEAAAGDASTVDDSTNDAAPQDAVASDDATLDVTAPDASALDVAAPDASAPPDVAPAADPALVAYRQRAAMVLDCNVAALTAWATANAAVADNANPGRLSMWTAAAGFARGASDPAALRAARKLAASLLERRVLDLFSGGNDGWPAWATADTRVRFGALIAADPARYAPAGFAANPDAPDGRYSLDDLFRVVLTRSYYAPIDSTSNHYLMNSTARFLAEAAYPGRVARAFADRAADPTGANDIATRADGLTTAGPSEYGSPNYGADNWGEFLSVLQLAPTSTPLGANARRASAIAYGVALADMGAFWMDGNLAMPTGRGYPSTGAWGVAAGDVLTWVYFGGDFGYATLRDTICDTGEKTLGVLGALGALGGYDPPAGTLHLADPVPRVSQAEFGQNHQYSYMTARYGHSSESYKFGAHGGWQTHWSSRVVWTKPYAQSYQATAWVANVGVNATLDASGVPQPTLDGNGSPQSVDPITLQPYALYGSGTYGTCTYEDFTQDRDTVLHVYNVPPRVLAGTPGGTMPIRGALLYVPIPRVQDARGQWVTATADYLPPEIARDGRRVFVGYGNVFISFNASAPIATPRATDVIAARGAQFFRIYGGPEADRPVDPGSYIQFAVAVQTASPGDYPGATLAEKFAAFQTAMLRLGPPRMVVVDRLHPVWQFADGRVTLTNTYQGDRYHGGNDGLGQDWIGGPANEDPTVIDYDAWPMLRERWLSGGAPLVDQAQGGNLTVSFPGTETAFYDLRRDVLTVGANVNLTATSDAAATVALAWRGGLGEAGWRVERSTDGDAWATLPAAASLPPGATGFVDTGLTQGAGYYYRVTPLGTSRGPSAPAWAAARFAAPSDLQVQVTAANAVRLTWRNNAVGAVNARLQYAPDGSEQWITFDNRPPTQTTYNVGSLPAGARRFYRVLAVSPTASSAPSARVGAEASAATVGSNVSMPEYLTAAVGPSRVTLRWRDTATNETAYRVERSTGGGAWTTVASLPADATTHVDTAVTPGANYAYRVVALAGTVASAPSNPVSVTAAR
ncbi:MAG: fibronectin type III domain-containing protein [Polyangiales bacterium]